MPKINSMSYRQFLPPDVLSWHELYKIFEQAGLDQADEATYYHQVKDKHRKIVMEAFRYKMAHIKTQLANEVRTGKLVLDKHEWDQLYTMVLTSPVPSSFALVDKLNRLRSLAGRHINTINPPEIAHSTTAPAID